MKGARPTQHSVAKPVRVRTSDVTRGRCLKPNDKTVDRATGWNRFQADASLALVVFQMVTLIAEGTSRAGASEVELAEVAARSVSLCWAQALITVLRPAVGEARSPRSQTYHLASRDEVPAPSRGLRPTTLAGEEALEFDQRRLRRFEQRRSATARREVDAAVAGLVLHRNFIKTVDARRCLLICAPQTDRAESYRHQSSHRVISHHTPLLLSGGHTGQGKRLIG